MNSPIKYGISQYQALKNTLAKTQSLSSSQKALQAVQKGVLCSSLVTPNTLLKESIIQNPSSRNKRLCLQVPEDCDGIKRNAAFQIAPSKSIPTNMSSALRGADIWDRMKKALGTERRDALTEGFLAAAAAGSTENRLLRVGKGEGGQKNPSAGLIRHRNTCWARFVVVTLGENPLICIWLGRTSTFAWRYPHFQPCFNPVGWRHRSVLLLPRRRQSRRRGCTGALTSTSPGCLWLSQTSSVLL